MKKLVETRGFLQSPMLNKENLTPISDKSLNRFPNSRLIKALQTQKHQKHLPLCAFCPGSLGQVKPL